MGNTVKVLDNPEMKEKLKIAPEMKEKLKIIPETKEKLKISPVQSYAFSGHLIQFTPPIAEIIWVKNVKAIVVCGFLMK